MEKDYCPRAWCRLQKDRDVWIWEVMACPYCGCRHQHGGGNLTENLFRGLGYRLSHCQGKAESYELRTDNPNRDKKFMERQLQPK